MDANLDSQQTFYSVEKSINFNFAHLLRNTDIMNIPFPTTKLISLIYSKLTDTKNNLKGICMFFYENNFIIQKKVFYHYIIFI